MLRKFQYGSDPNRIVELTEDQAWAVNNVRIEPVDADQELFRINLNARQLKDYDAAAQILNDDLAKNGPAEYTDVTKDVLIPLH